MQWIPTRCHSDSSLLVGLSRTKDIVRKCVQVGLPGAVLCDQNSISAALEYVSAAKDCCASCGYQKDSHDDSGKCLIKGVTCKGFEKSKFKPIFGCELNLCAGDPKIHTPDNQANSTACLISKNIGGWRKLISTVSASYRPDHFYKMPRLNLESLAEIVAGKDLFVTTGHVGSDLSASLFKDQRAAFLARTLDDVRSLLRDDWKKSAKDTAGRYVDMFGKENVLINIQLVDHASSPVAVATAKCLRVIAKEMGLRRIAANNSFYCDKEDAVDQRVLISSKLETSLDRARDEVYRHEEYWLSSFFRGNDKHIPDLEEVGALYEADEIKTAIEVFEECETYSIESRPLLPNFETPNCESQAHFLRKLCNKGMLERYGQKPTDVEIARLGHESGVIGGADLAGYFNIIWDICRFAREAGIMMGRGRGSAAGCLSSFLLRVTNLDPISHSLLFERFYNAGRNTAQKVSLPDVDLDVCKGRRSEVIAYIRDKYGNDRVAHMCTFAKLQGRGCLKDVMRSGGKISFEEMNEITKWVPDPAKISGDLQEAKEEYGESSIIEWALEHHVKQLRPWASMDKEGNITGPMATVFEQAVRLENTKRSMGKHASGIVVASTPLAQLCPMVLDKSGNPMTGFEMGACERVGLVKVDVLGVAILDKIRAVVDLLEFGEMRSVES